MNKRMKEKPLGFTAKCRCGVFVGAMDCDRTERKEAGKLLGEWLMNGCTIEPQFNCIGERNPLSL